LKALLSINKQRESRVSCRQQVESVRSQNSDVGERRELQRARDEVEIDIARAARLENRRAYVAAGGEASDLLSSRANKLSPSCLRAMELEQQLTQLQGEHTALQQHCEGQSALLHTKPIFYNGQYRGQLSLTGLEPTNAASFSISCSSSAGPYDSTRGGIHRGEDHRWAVCVRGGDRISGQVIERVMLSLNTLRTRACESVGSGGGVWDGESKPGAGLRYLTAEEAVTKCSPFDNTVQLAPGQLWYLHDHCVAEASKARMHNPSDPGSISFQLVGKIGSQICCKVFFEGSPQPHVSHHRLSLRVQGSESYNVDLPYKGPAGPTAPMTAGQQRWIDDQVSKARLGMPSQGPLTPYVHKAPGPTAAVSTSRWNGQPHSPQKVAPPVCDIKLVRLPFPTQMPSLPQAHSDLSHNGGH